ncbi:MAG: hypothetical protein AB1758_00805 [Candidatus Eremiobacterota bacterium]
MAPPRPLPLGELAIVVCVLALLAAILVPNFIKARARGQLTSCKSNLKNLGTALEMYARDNGGRYPRTMFALTPNYLKVIPECSFAGRDSYSATYRSAGAPAAYTFCCGGLHHKSAGITAPNYPQYTSTQGLVERP